MYHCAEFIQKHWRRHHICKVVMPKIRSKKGLAKITKGWRIRRILNGCEEVIEIRKDLAAIEGELLAFTNLKDPRIRKTMKLRKFKVEELIHCV